MATLSKTFDFVINRRGGTVLKYGEQEVERNLREVFGAAVGSILFVEGKDIKPTVRRWVRDHNGQGKTNSLVIGGGDGSVMSAAEEIMGSDITLGVLPLGTHNLFARQLGFAAHYREAAAQYKNSTEQEVDVGSVNGMNFLVGLTLDKSTVSYYTGREAVRDRKFLASARQFASMVSAAALEGEQTLRVSGSDVGMTEQRGRVFAVTINALTPHPAKSGKIKPKSIIENAFARDNLSGGELAFYAFKGGIGGTVSIARKIWEGGWDQDETVSLIKAPGFFIDNADGDSRDVSVVIDGEIKTTQYPLKLSLKPKGLKVFRPQ